MVPTQAVVVLLAAISIAGGKTQSVSLLHSRLTPRAGPPNLQDAMAGVIGSAGSTGPGAGTVGDQGDLLQVHSLLFKIVSVSKLVISPVCPRISPSFPSSRFQGCPFGGSGRTVACIRCITDTRTEFGSIYAFHVHFVCV